MLMLNPTVIYVRMSVDLALFFFAIVGAWSFAGFIADLFTEPSQVASLKAFFKAHEQEYEDKIRAELLEEYGDPEDYQSAREDVEETLSACAARLNRALEHMRRGEVKDARYEIEDTVEELRAA